jgi:hypothetical protein
MSSEDVKPPDIANITGLRPILDWDNVEITFSDWVLIQGSADGSVILSFFQARHPYYYTEQEREEAQDTIHCLARFAVSPGQFDKIVELYTGFQRQLKEFLETREKAESQEKA